MSSSSVLLASSPSVVVLSQPILSSISSSSSSSAIASSISWPGSSSLRTRGWATIPVHRKRVAVSIGGKVRLLRSSSSSCSRAAAAVAGALAFSACSSRRLPAFPVHVGLRQGKATGTASVAGGRPFSGKVIQRWSKSLSTPRCEAKDGRINQAEFTDMAWQAIVASPDVAKESKQQIVETEHLMKALLEQRNGLARRIFAKAGVDNTSLLQATDRYIQRQPKVMGGNSGSMLGRDLEALIDRAKAHQKDLGDSFVSVEHLVLGFLQDKRFGQQLFKEFQLSAKTLNASIQAVRGSQKVTDQGY